VARSVLLLPALVLAHGLGIAAADAALVGRAGALAGATAGLGITALARALPARLAGSALAAASAGALALSARLDQARRHAPVAPFESVLDADVASVRALGARVLVELETAERDVAGREIPRRIRLVEDAARDPGLASLVPGDRLRAAVRLRAAESRHDPGVSDTRRRLARAGVGALARELEPGLRVGLQTSGCVAPRRVLEAVRGRIRERLLAAGEGGALLAALSVGDRRGLGSPEREAFARLGLTHLLSVSGLHLVLAAALFQRVALAALRRSAWLARRDARRLALAVALVGATLYALLAGFDVPVQRSLVFVAAAGAAFLARRPLRASSLLATAALAVLAADPAALFDVGAQLSFAASAALVLAPPLATRVDADRGPLRRVGDAVRDGLSTSALASAATAPLLATQLGVTAPAGLAANALAVPFTGALLLPAALFGALCAAVPDAPGARFGIEAASWLGAASLAALRAVAAHAGDVAPAAPPPGTLVLLAGLALAALALRARRVRTRLLLAFAAALLPALVPPAPRPPALPRAFFLDVGQGDATLVQGREASVLIDAGTALPDGADLGRLVVVPALRALGATRIDVAVATHADLDHRGGLASVLASFPVGELWLPHGAADEPGFAALRRIAAEEGVPVREHGAGDAIWRRGDVALAPLWPPRAPAPGASRNERSLVLRIEVGGRHLLLPGDAGRPTEQALVASGVVLRSDVLKLGHHGSRSASGTAWLAAVSPRLAVASAPCRGRFGMPHAEVVARVAAAGASLWWTGRDGAVSVALGDFFAASGEAPAGVCTRRLARPSAPAPDGTALLDEGALPLARVLAPAERAADLLLAAVGDVEGLAQELAYTTARLLDRERRVGGDRVGASERRAEELLARDDAAHEADLERARCRDRACREQELEGVHPADLPWQEHRRVAGRVEAERDLLEREGRLGHREAELRGEHQIEAARPRVSVHRGHERLPEIEAREQRGVDAAQTFEGLVVEAFAARETLRRRDRAGHVHAGAEDAARARQHRAADRVVVRDAAPGVGQGAQHRRVEAVRALGMVERDQCDVGVGGQDREVDGHGHRVPRAAPRLASVRDLGRRRRAHRRVARRRADPKLAPDLVDGARQQCLPVLRREPGCRAAAAMAFADHAPLDGAPRLEPGHGHDEAHAPVPGLRVAEGEERSFADEVTPVAGDDVPEVMHVAQAVAHEASLVAWIPTPAAFGAGGDEAVGAQLLAVDEVGVGPAQAALGQGAERRHVLQGLEQRAPLLQDPGARGLAAEALEELLAGAARERVDDAEHLGGVVRVSHQRTDRAPGVEGPDAARRGGGGHVRSSVSGLDSGSTPSRDRRRLGIGSGATRGQRIHAAKEPFTDKDVSSQWPQTGQDDPEERP